MKVLTFSTLYPSATRPTHGIFVENRLRQLLGSGKVEATVVAPVPWFPFTHSAFGAYAAHARTPPSEVRHGVRVLHPRFPVLPKLGTSVAPFLLARAMAAPLRSLLPFDLIDAHYFYPEGVAAVMLGRALAKPVVITARGTDVNLIAQYALPRRMIRWAARKAASVITVSQALKDRLVDLGVEKSHIQVLRNGIDLELFRPMPGESRQVGRRKLLSVGNLLLFKGHGFVIEALRYLPECDLVVVGTGPDRQKLERIAQESGVSERVRFAGGMNQEALRNEYATSDVLVLASSREGWPNVLLEAMACGTPVIATRVGGTSEIVTSRDAGLLIDECSPEAVARAVQQLLSNYPDRSATRRHAEQFGWGPTTQGQLRLFEQVLAREMESTFHVRHFRNPAA